MKSSVCMIALLSLFSAAKTLAQSAPMGPPHMPAAKTEIKTEVKTEIKTMQHPIRLRFANTDVSEILQAIGLKTHANLVFPSQLKKSISVNLVAGNLDEALNFVGAAAGLTYRKMGATYIVAAPAEMRQALQAFGTTERIPLHELSSADATALLETALPFVTVKAAGSRAILVTGSPEDIAQAHSMLNEQQQTQASDPQARDTVLLKHADPEQVTAMLKSIFPNLKAEIVGSGITEKSGNAPKSGGALVIAGLRSQVQAAREAINGVDVETTAQAPERIYRVYEIKYSSAPVLREFLEKAVPTVSSVVGPEAYSPPQSQFNPLSGATLGGSSGGSSGGFSGGGNTGSSTNSGSSAGSSSSSGSAGGATSTSGGSGGATQTSRQGDKAKTLVLMGPQGDVESAIRLLDKLDIPPVQVMVDVKVVDISRDKEEQLGLEYNWGTFNFLEAPVGTLPTTTLATRPKQFGYFSRLPWNINATLNAMTTRNEAKILADPRIQVIDNNDANIFIGDTIRTSVSQSSISGTTIQVLEFPIGIILLVRPRVNGDGRITLRVHPVVSTVTQIVSGIPQTASREAETTVMIKDGETMVIGGLIRDEMSKSIQEVPLLSKLPLVGELFRNRSTSVLKTEVLVFITPHIIH